MIFINLNNNRISARELLSNPEAKKVLLECFPILKKNEKLLLLANNLTLEQVISIAKGYVPQKKINDCLERLKKL